VGAGGEPAGEEVWVGRALGGLKERKGVVTGVAEEGVEMDNDEGCGWVEPGQGWV